VIMPLTQRIGDSPDGKPRYASFWEFFIDVGKDLKAPDIPIGSGPWQIERCDGAHRRSEPVSIRG
jgi:hypothetical protein